MKGVYHHHQAGLFFLKGPHTWRCKTTKMLLFIILKSGSPKVTLSSKLLVKRLCLLSSSFRWLELSLTWSSMTAVYACLIIISHPTSKQSSWGNSSHSGLGSTFIPYKLLWTCMQVQRPINSQVPGLGLKPIFEGDIIQHIALGKKEFWMILCTLYFLTSSIQTLHKSFHYPAHH